MRRQWTIIVIIIVIIISALAVIIFLKRDYTMQTKRMHIVCTTGMITDAVKRIGGKYLEVHGLMGPGVDPHLYRARESDMHRLAQAEIIFYNGLHLEGKMADLFASMQRSKNVIAVSDAISKEQLMASEFLGMYDPHIWHDVNLWMHVITYIKDQLQIIDSQHANTYEQNARVFLKELESLDQYVKLNAQQVSQEQRILVTAHDAFSYFGNRYGFKVVGLQGFSTDSEVGIKDIQQLVSFIIKHQVPAIFVESSIPQRSIVAVQKAVEARGWSVIIGDELFSDALGDNTGVTYIDMIKHNVDSIVAALTKKIDTFDYDT